MAVVQLFAGDVRRHVGQCWDNVKTSGIDVGILGICGGPVEGTSAETIQLYLVLPHIGVQLLEFVLPDKTVLSSLVITFFFFSVRNNLHYVLQPPRTTHN